MYEMEVKNRYTQEEETIYGYNFEDACRRYKCNPDDYILLGAWYVD